MLNWLRSWPVRWLVGVGGLLPTIPYLVIPFFYVVHTSVAQYLVAGQDPLWVVVTIGVSVLCMLAGFQAGMTWLLGRRGVGWGRYVLLALAAMVGALAAVPRVLYLLSEEHVPGGQSWLIECLGWWAAVGPPVAGLIVMLDCLRLAWLVRKLSI